VNGEGKYIVDVEKDVDVSKCVPNARVALRSDSYALHRILPSKVDPLVSLMRVEKVPDATYDMVGGLSKQIQEMKEVIELPIKHPELFEALGVSQPKGILMYGPPGTGKTLLARAVAHHTDCTFIRVSGSELVQKYIGEGARMVRELFVMAREKAPSIIFMDEVDSIGSKRSDSGRGDSEVQRTMLELLNQLDGFEPTQNIKVVMATNRIDILDPALLRPVSACPRWLPLSCGLLLCVAGSYRSQGGVPPPQRGEPGADPQDPQPQDESHAGDRLAQDCSHDGKRLGG
jgi:26S proteasome regulatory subunit T6